MLKSELRLNTLISPHWLHPPAMLKPHSNDNQSRITPNHVPGHPHQLIPTFSETTGLLCHTQSLYHQFFQNAFHMLKANYILPVYSENNHFHQATKSPGSLGSLSTPPTICAVSLSLTSSLERVQEFSNVIPEYKVHQVIDISYFKRVFVALDFHIGKA
jgi:hypothetical protein